MSKDRNNKKGFTLAEVLITLTIIGVVAALTIPSLLANISEKTYDSKRKGLTTRMAQAISQLDALNSYEAKRPSDYTGSLNATQYSEENSAMNLVVEGLSKVYKLTNVCEFDKYAACDFPSKFSTPYGVTTTSIQTYNFPTLYEWNPNATAARLGGVLAQAVVFRTKNGESILLYYNPKCVAEQGVDSNNTKSFAKEICMHMVYDLDGAKRGPNQFGLDVGAMTVLYPDTPYLVSPHPDYGGFGYFNMASYSTSTADDGSASARCHAGSGRNVNKGEWTLPSREELYSISMSYQIIYSFGDQGWNFSSTVEGSGPDDYAWYVNKYTLYAKRILRNVVGTYRLDCIIDKS